MARWRPGQSGNLRGRPKGSRNKSTAAVKDLLAKHVSFDNLIIRLDKLAQGGNVRAAELLLAYGFGRPTEKKEIESKVVSLPDLSTVPPEELNRELVKRCRLSAMGVDIVSE